MNLREHGLLADLGLPDFHEWISYLISLDNRGATHFKLSLIELHSLVVLVRYFWGRLPRV